MPVRTATSLLLLACLLSLGGCVVETVAPQPGPPGAVWVAGHYHGWRWVPGHWER